MRNKTTVLTGVLALCIAAGLHAQLPADTTMMLNRVGRWDEAARIARGQLATASLSADDRCTVHTSLAYAETRLAHIDSARAAIHAARWDCTGIANPTPAEKQLAQLERELGKPPTAPARSVRAEDNFWKTAPVASSGLDPAVLKQHLALCERSGADACLVIHHDAIVQEWYSPRYTVPMMAMSSTKSVTGLLTAMLIADGKITSLDDRACRYISQWCDGIRGSVTLRHLLTMTSGLPRLRDSSVGFVSDKDAWVLHLMPVRPPGTVWAYSNEGAQLLSPILDRAAGEPIQDYARRRLFEPLGMSNTTLHVDVAGHAWTYADMYTTPRDLARIGVLMLHHGEWGGRQIVPPAWIDSLVTAQPHHPGYGLLWWIEPGMKGYAALGHLDTDLIVVPDLDLIVVRMQSKPYPGAQEGDYLREARPLLRALVRKRFP